MKVVLHVERMEVERWGWNIRGPDREENPGRGGPKLGWLDEVNPLVPETFFPSIFEV